MRVIVTRPEPEATRWAVELRALGLDAVALPLIEIVPSRHAALLQQTWARVQQHHYQALMFVSGSAASHFFAAMPAEDAASLGSTRTWATGPGTHTALQHAGIAPAQIDAPTMDAGQFDSEALWQRIAPQVTRGSRILVVRGGGLDGESAGRNWLMEQLLAAGAQVDTAVAYERHPPQFTPEQLALARQATQDGSVWLLSSSEAVSHLVDSLAGQPLTAARAIATHPRIAQAARAAGFGVVCSSRPTLADIAASIESLI